jgi:hypothetical protein
MSTAFGIEKHIQEQCTHSELIHGQHIPLNDTDTTYVGLFNRYVTSPYGLSHAQEKPRFFQRYGYEPSQMLEDLGDDVHPVFHMRHTHDVPLVGLLAVQNSGEFSVPQFTALEIVACRLTAYVHDMGEGTHTDFLGVVKEVVGDKAWGTKSAEDDQKESAIRRFIFEKLFTDIPTEILNIVDRTILEPEDSPLGKPFEITERIGYYLTAMRAGKIALEAHFSNRSDRDEISLSQLTKLALIVSNNHHGVLDQNRYNYPFADLVLSKNEVLFKNIQSKLKPLT